MILIYVSLLRPKGSIVTIKLLTAKIVGRASLVLTVILTSCNYSEIKSPGPVPTATASTDKLWLFDNLFSPKCGSCHTSSGSLTGGYAFDELTAFNSAVARGISPGNAEESELYSVIQTGTMPPSGSTKPSETETAVLKCWINAGASDSAKNCLQELNVTARTTPQPLPIPSSSPTPAPTQTPNTTNPAAPKDIGWLKDNLFETSCVKCHNEEIPKGGYKFDTIPNIMFSVKERGGAEPGNSASSLISQVIASGDMPPRSFPVKPTDLAKRMLNCWIDHEASETSSICFETFVATPPDSAQFTLPPLSIRLQDGSP